MSIPVLVLLAFAGWTLLIVVTTIGRYRWGLIFKGRKQIVDFAEYRVEGRGWYTRALRAHANCIENLAVYGAIVLVIVATDTHAPLLDALAVILMGARVLHTTVHITLEPTNVTTVVRFVFYFAQLVCMLWMIGYLALEAV